MLQRFSKLINSVKFSIMNNREIEFLLTRNPATRSVFAGVFARNTLPGKPRARKPYAYIVNTANAETSGEHWICIYHPVVGIPEYFDSYGMDAPKIFELFMSNRYKKSVVRLQHQLTTVCGQYCLYYICMRSVYHKSMDEILGILYGERKLNSDVYVNHFVEEFFLGDFDVQDLDFMINARVS